MVAKIHMSITAASKTSACQTQVTEVPLAKNVWDSVDTDLGCWMCRIKLGCIAWYVAERSAQFHGLWCYTCYAKHVEPSLATPHAMPAEVAAPSPLVQIVKVHTDLQQADMAHICDLLAAYAKAKSGQPPLIADLAADMMVLTPKVHNSFLQGLFDSFTPQQIADMIKGVAAGVDGPMALSQGMRNAGEKASSISSASKLRAAVDVALANPKAKGGQYWAFNVDCVPRGLPAGQAVWGVFEAMSKHYKGQEYLEAHAQLHRMYLSLVLVSNSETGTGTPLHLDVSGANTVHLLTPASSSQPAKRSKACETSSPATCSTSDHQGSATASNILCTWLQLIPAMDGLSYINKRLLDAEMERPTLFKKLPKGFTLPPVVEGQPLPNPSKVQAWPLLTDMDMRWLAGKADNHGRITVHDVRHGDIMSPTPGHMHAVYNLQPLLKVACEVVKPGSFLRTAVSLRVFASGVVGPRMAEDYTSFFALSHRKLRQDFWAFQQQQQQELLQEQRQQQQQNEKVEQLQLQQRQKQQVWQQQQQHLWQQHQKEHQKQQEQHKQQKQQLEQQIKLLLKQQLKQQEQQQLKEQLSQQLTQLQQEHEVPMQQHQLQEHQPQQKQPQLQLQQLQLQQQHQLQQQQLKHQDMQQSKQQQEQLKQMQKLQQQVLQREHQQQKQLLHKQQQQ